MRNTNKIAPFQSIIVIMVVSTAAFPHHQDVPQATEDKAAHNISNRSGMLAPPISGDKIAAIHEFPWTVLLLYSNNDTNMVYHSCGGVLVNSNFVVTAAHCVIDGNNMERPLKFVRLREYDINSDTDCIIRDEYMLCSEPVIDSIPRNITIHPEYNTSDHNSYHDIALIEIDPISSYSDFLQPICLPEPEMDNGMTVGKKFVVSGWGRTDIFRSRLGGKVPSPIKRKVFLPYVEPKTCEEMLRWKTFKLGSGQICAGSKIGKDTCNGDSGSPLMHYDTKRGVWVLAGIVSLGMSNCGAEEIPGVYTNVRKYLRWIKHHARITSPSQDIIDVCDGISVSLITGHDIVKIREFPWTAMLFLRSDDETEAFPGCAGSVINRNFVITSAHCVVSSGGNHQLDFVRLREYDITSDTDCVIEEEEDMICSEPVIDAQPKNIIIHPGFNVKSRIRGRYHDIALIEIDPIPSYSDFLRPICLPEPDMAHGMTVGKLLIVAGWGVSDIFTNTLDKDMLSPIKRKVFLPYFDWESCKKIYQPKRYTLGFGQLCAGGEYGRDSCRGDSGAPLMHFDTRKGVWVLTGIVAFGMEECGKEGIPGVYTNVREYLWWIKYHAGMMQHRRSTSAVAEQNCV